MFEIIFVIVILIPITLVSDGFFLKYHMPDDIIGYRTKRSMSSREAWIFANKTCEKLWLTGGIIIFVFSVFVPLLLYMLKGDSAGFYSGVIVLILQSIFLIFSVVYIEKQLICKFDN